MVAHGLRLVCDKLCSMASDFTRQICVVGFVREKNIDEILPLLPKRAYYIFTQANVSRALPADELSQKAAEAGLIGEVVPTVEGALARAREMAVSTDMIFVGGSNFVVAEVL